VKKKVYGVGVNDADYVVQIRKDMPKLDGKRVREKVWTCPFYSRWADMLYRCYSPAAWKTHPRYEGCSVIEEWHTFSNFKAWMEKQDWEGKHLDKDILVTGNKVYSSETCVFISLSLNNFLCSANSIRGEWPVGVSKDKKNGKFSAYCYQGNNTRKFLGYFATPDQAHLAWVKEKTRIANLLADSESDQRVANALRAIDFKEMYTNE